MGWRAYMLRHRAAGLIGAILVLTLVMPLVVLIPGASAQGQPSDVDGRAMRGSAGASHGHGSKVHGLLAMQVDAKQTRRGQGPDGLGPPANGTRPDIIGSIAVASPDTQSVFLYFEEKPSASQIDELVAVGVSVDVSSWIPPLENHPLGFLRAQMPIDRLDDVAAMGAVVSMASAEVAHQAHNDQAGLATHAFDSWSGTPSYDGTGVTIAVLDSGFEVGHPDFPLMSGGTNYRDFSDDATGPSDYDVANSVTGHGTHVAGTALGGGTASSGVYRGAAYGANPVLMKIGDDSTSNASTAAIVYAMQAAVDTYDADVVTMSYGGWGSYHDGSEAECQAVDYCVSQGAMVLISAGNDGDMGWHYSGTVSANSWSDWIEVDANETSGLFFNMVWGDGIGVNRDLDLYYYRANQTTQLSPVSVYSSESTRGTESEMSYYGSGGSLYGVNKGTYYLRVYNDSASDQFFHLYYQFYSDLAFADPDPDYTLGTPADADGAIAVGAYTTRSVWYDYQNDGWTYGFTEDQYAPFSSRGPRVDGVQKPDVMAPGSAIISMRDDDAYPWASASALYIDNDGPNEYSAAKNNASTGEEARYYVMQGTSMAAPHAAGVVALICQAHPDWTPAQVRSALESTALDMGDAGHDSIYGWGLVNAEAALTTVSFSSPTYSVSESVVSGTATVTVGLSRASSQTVTIGYATSDGTTAAGIDYTPAGGTLTFSPGETSQSFPVFITGDSAIEVDETINLALIDPSNAVLGAQTGATLTIIDDDFPDVSFASAEYSVVEGVESGTATITVVLSAMPAQTAHVGYATFDGTAVAGIDYVSASGTLTFSPGEISQSFPVSITGDGAIEVDETIGLALTDPSNAVLGTQNSATLTIADDDFPDVSFASADYSVVEGVESGTATITVVLSATPAQTALVGYAAFDGTALAGIDYVSASGTVTFVPGEVSKSFAVSILDDGEDEGNETVNLTLTTLARADLGMPNTSVLSIVDDDDPGFAAVDISVMLQGVNRPDPDGWELPIMVKLFEPGGDVLSGTPVYVSSGTTARSVEGASFALSDIAPGTYDIAVVSEHTLMNVKRNATVLAPDTSVQMGTLLEGDANEDDGVNLLDFNILKACYLKYIGDPGYDASADFNRDGGINLLDFNLLKASYLKYSPVEVP